MLLLKATVLLPCTRLESSLEKFLASKLLSSGKYGIHFNQICMTFVPFLAAWDCPDFLHYLAGKNSIVELLMK